MTDMTTSFSRHHCLQVEAHLASILDSPIARHFLNDEEAGFLCYMKDRVTEERLRLDSDCHAYFEARIASAVCEDERTLMNYLLHCAKTGTPI